MNDSSFAQRLLDWFGTQKRDLPWRRTKDPYHIWVSEIMLQQTRVDTVIPYFLRFIERFPTPEALASALEEDVLKLWEGLGYYSRARNLQAAVREVQVKYGGVVPDTREAISSLKGVGPYTAGAILSIAYGLPEPAVDGNVLRVMARYFGLHDDIAKAKTRVRVEHLLKPLIPADAAGDFTQALMELGALVCVPKSPKCEVCPVQNDCVSLSAGLQHELPVKSKSKPPRHELRAVAWIERTMNGERQLLLRQRPDGGLLANLWELPNTEMVDDDHESFGADCERNFSLRLRNQTELLEIDHVFSHLHWHLRVYRFTCDTDGDRMLPAEMRWVPVQQLEKYAYPLVFSKIIRQGLML